MECETLAPGRNIARLDSAIVTATLGLLHTLPTAVFPTQMLHILRQLLQAEDDSPAADALVCRNTAATVATAASKLSQAHVDPAIWLTPLVYISADDSR